MLGKLLWSKTATHPAFEWRVAFTGLDPLFFCESQARALMATT